MEFELEERNGVDKKPISRRDSLTDVSMELLTEEEKARLKKIKESLNESYEPPREKWFQRPFFRSPVWLYLVLVVGAIMFVMSVVFSSTQIRELTGTMPKCVTSSDHFKLPHSISPLSYAITLRPNFTTLEFSGVVQMRFGVINPTYCLFFHAKHLEIDRISLKEGAKGDPFDWDYSFTHNNRTDIALVQYKNYVRAEEEYILEIEYRGGIRVSEMQGWYKSTFLMAEKESFVFATHFECCAARMVFPCLDEPSFKATFQTTIEVNTAEVLPVFYGNKSAAEAWTRPSDFTILANTPVEESELVTREGNSTRRLKVLVTKFAKTPVMSSYLVAFAVGRLKNITTYIPRTVSDTPSSGAVSVYLTPNHDVQASGEFALEVARVVTERFGSFFAFDYFNGVEKLDLIGLSDFSAGAMENWGLITFREKYLICSTNTSLSHNITSAKVIAHEVAHQWTGNLVTLEWWDDMFINEGLTTFFEYYILGGIGNKIEYSSGGDNYSEEEEEEDMFSTWPIDDIYFVSEFFPVLASDSMFYTKSLTHRVSSPEEIEAKFDKISYNKGSCVMRMIRDFLGFEQFRQFMVSMYFSDYYASESASDLVSEFKAFQALFYYNNSVHKKFDISRWLANPGYPLVQIDFAIGDGNYVISQSRFFSYPPKKGGSEDILWDVFIQYYTSDYPKTIHNVTLSEKDANFAVPGVEWFKFNPDLTGYYRVNYPVEMWEKFIFVMQKYEEYHLTVFDKAGLVDDAFEIAKAGKLAFKIPLEMALALRRTPSYLLFRTVSRHLVFISNLLKGTTLNQLLNAYIANYVDHLSEIVADSSSQSQSQDDPFLREILLDLQVRSENQTVIKTLVNQYASDIDSIPISQRSAVLGVLVKYGNNMFAEMLSRFTDTKDISYFYATTAAILPDQISRVLDMLLTDEVRPQDGLFVLRELLRNPSANELAWNWIRHYFEEIMLKYERQTFEKYVLPALAASFSMEIKVKEMTSFFEGKVDQMSLNQAIEYTELNVHCIESNFNQIQTFLRERYGD